MDQLQTECKSMSRYGLIREAQSLAPILKPNGGGILCQVTSVASRRCPFPSVSTYCASEAAAFRMTQALRASLQEQHTHVMSIHPGPISTDGVVGREDLSKIGAMDTPENCPREFVQFMRKRETFFVFPDPISKSLRSNAHAPFVNYVFEKGNIH
jgi:NAD(P)-dependent dehydrogenase (short-subunit alcohol dehydrogenase family)